MNIETITNQIITVDYGKSLQDMIEAGKYDSTNDEITAKRFPVQGLGSVQFETKVFHFNRRISSEDVVVAIKADDRQNPWEPAKIEGLVAYGAKNPEEQRNYPIIGLGSVASVGGARYVPYLHRFGAERILGLRWWGDDWHGSYRFLGVRNLPSAA